MRKFYLSLEKVVTLLTCVGVKLPRFCHPFFITPATMPKPDIDRRYVGRDPWARFTRRYGPLHWFFGTVIAILLWLLLLTSVS